MTFLSKSLWVSGYTTSHPRWDVFSMLLRFIFQRPASASLSSIQKDQSNLGTDGVRESITLVKQHRLTPSLQPRQGGLCACLRTVRRIAANIYDCKEVRVTFPFSEF